MSISYTREDFPYAVQTVRYQAGNRLLILGDLEQLLRVYPRLSKDFHISFLLPKDVPVNELLKRKIEPFFATGNDRLEGYLGRFTLNGADTRFDFVLDMQEAPAIDLSVPSLGYYRLYPESHDLNEIVETLPQMIGTFEKPKFFRFDSKLCAHGDFVDKGCRRCIEVCATGAISSAGRVPEVNPYLCQGCGDCSTVCPSGAMQYQFPDLSTTLESVKRQLQQFDQPPIAVFHQRPQDLDIQVESPVASFKIEALGSIGIEVWLAALAYGAKQVLLYRDPAVTSETDLLLQQQLAIARTLILGLGYEESLIQYVDGNDFVSIGTSAFDKKATFAEDNDKRTVIQLAMAHLIDQAFESREFISLPQGAPFGDIKVDSICSLCMSCVSACPSQALMSNPNEPQLRFIEVNCVQCGICADLCPEHAIVLQPRFLYDRNQAKKSRILHEDSLFDCVECGKGFASRTMIHNMLAKLEQHPMFQGEKQRQLMMCHDCRINHQFKKAPL